MLVLHLGSGSPVKGASLVEALYRLGATTMLTNGEPLRADMVALEQFVKVRVIALGQQGRFRD